MSLISGFEKVWTREWGEGKYQGFPLKNFCLTVTKIFVGQPLSVSLISGIEKFYASEVMSRFSVQNILSHSDEIFRWATLKCVINFGYRKILCFGRLYHVFPSKIYCLTVPKNDVGDPLVFH